MKLKKRMAKFIWELEDVSSQIIHLMKTTTTATVKKRKKKEIPICLSLETIHPIWKLDSLKIQKKIGIQSRIITLTTLMN